MSDRKVEAVILAGGTGTRLRPFTISIPKPLLPISDLPIMEIALRQLRASGIKRICISLGHLAPLIQNFFGDGSKLGIDLSYVVEDEPLGTAGALTLIPDLADDFIVQNGDTLTDLDYRRLVAAHRSSGATATIFTQQVNDLVDYGVVEFDSNFNLVAYHEKPTRHYHVSTGVYVLNRGIVGLAQPGQRLDMPNLLQRARAQRDKICCYIQEGAYWRDIGRFDHYEAATKDFEADRARFLYDDK
ncbi:MAG: sugar phosphate nucleotidyltransferase [Ensifer adhaerens]